MASVYSTYEIRTHKTDAEPRSRGITHCNLRAPLLGGR